MKNFILLFSIVIFTFSVQCGVQVSTTSGNGCDFYTISSTAQLDSEVGINQLPATTYARLAQSFQITTSDAQTVAGIKLRLQKTGSPSGSVEVKIESESSSFPSGTAVTGTASINTTSISTTESYYTFTFPSQVILSTNTTYWVVVTGTYSQSSTDYVTWKGTTTSTLYTDGTSAVFQSGGGSYSTGTLEDFGLQLVCGTS
ncbi:MAG: hypothetical protein CL678_12740 [Bdellovibrionaceae bacterium]|nr:hypothetical protein [Pseudobdellovibrionaceae bacterium]|tara:strand:+ start:1591 stop:2193 length:603 start_codon:yes stop_codon:yes gene_type:complete